MMFYSNHPSRAKASPLRAALAASVYLLRFAVRLPCAAFFGTIVTFVATVYSVAWFLFFKTPKVEGGYYDENGDGRRVYNEIWAFARAIFRWIYAHK